MRMIDRIKQAMRDTGVCDGMSDEDLDIAVTAALESMRGPGHEICVAGASANPYLDGEDLGLAGHIFDSMIHAALNE